MPLPQKKLIPGLLFALMLAAIAAPPLWWSTGNPPVIDPYAVVNNKGPANIGQAKHMAKSALDALRLVLPAVADQIETDLVGIGKPIPSWAAPTNQAERDKNLAPLLIGQLKAIADPFYTHLHAVAPSVLEAQRIANGTHHPNSIFPWTAEIHDDANKAIANIGQLKAVFSLHFENFQVYITDTDGDGMPDAWEIAHYLNPYDPSDAILDFDGDGLSNLQEFTLQGNPLNPDTSGDGISDGWAFAHGLSLPVNSSSGLFQGGPTTNLQAYQQGVQATPGATLQDLDADGLENDLDAVPRDGEINWLKTPEKRYVWVEQVERGGAKAVSKDGHILFPKNNVVGNSNLENVLWDSNTSSWVPLIGASSWYNSGFLALYGNTNSRVFDAEWLHIDDMNDEGVVVGRSKDIGINPDGPPPIYASAVMKWQMSGTATDQYTAPIYIVPGFNHIPYDLEKALENEAPRIADDGTISAVAYRIPGYYNTATVTEWVASDAQAIDHSKDMAVWGQFGWYWRDLKFRSGAVIGVNGGLLIENQITPPYSAKSILHYRNGAAAESLEGLLYSSANEITDTDISRTPATSASPEGRIWFSVNHTGGNAAFLEKRAGGSGVARWHNPPSMGEGAFRLNALGEAITSRNTSAPPKLWRNGIYTDLNDVNLTSKPTSVYITHAIDIASNGIILAQATEYGVTKTGLLVPVEVAPEVLAVNSDFDEGRIDPATGYAIPDCDDIPGVDQKSGSGNTQIALNASRAHLDGLFANDEKVTDDMHKGWFGVNPNQLGDDFWTGANVTIRKIDKIDSDTGYKESGQVRFYAKWSGGYYGIAPYDFQTLQPVNLVTGGVNGNNSSVYGASSTIPDGAEFYMEGVRPGKITLEWRLQKGSIDVKHEQTFLVATQKTKQAWIDEVIYQVKLQASDLGSDIDLNDYDPANGFFLPNSNNYKYIQTVYYYYMQLFQQYPEKFYWAGMAKTAGASVYAGMVDMATWKTSVFVSNQDVDKVLIDFMIQGNKDIFTDMAWAHHAYAASGIEALDYVEENETDRVTDFDAWRSVNEGFQESSIPKLREGNKLILRREQEVVMPPLYDKMKIVWLDPGTRLEQFLATDLAGIVYPPRNAAGKINIDEMFSINSRNPVQYQLGPSLRQVVPNGKLSSFNDRWAWIDNPQNGMLQIWLGTSTSVPGFSANERSNLNGSNLTEHAKIYSMLPTLGGLRDNQFPPPPW